MIADERQRMLWALVSRLEERCQRLLRVIAFAPPAIVIGTPMHESTDPWAIGFPDSSPSSASRQVPS